VIEIVQTVLTGLILAFIFRAFLVEPFIIPTGSMAETLLGAHANRVCPACGWEFSFAPLQATSPTGAGFVCPPEVVCPNCQTYLTATPADTRPKAGDRILVHKWPYELGGPCAPARWDVIVFRDPADPLQHYIKRLVGLPGETVEILDGDLFINGEIARKPPEIQRVLWYVVFDQAHLPAANTPAGARQRWTPVSPADGAAAGWHDLEQRVVAYDGLDGQARRLRFNPDAGPEYLLDLYAYNRHSSGEFVGDVRIQAELTLAAGNGYCELRITREPVRFTARMHVSGLAELEREDLRDPAEKRVKSAVGDPLAVNRPAVVEFAHLDYRVALRIDGREVLATTDAEYRPDVAALRRGPGRRPVGIDLAARGIRCHLAKLRIDRDLHYTSRAPQVARAGPAEPFSLGPGEYFVLGDNSPDSHDSREWTEVGPHLPAEYRAGTVLIDQIVGRAAFVYLPGVLPRGTSGRWFIPDLGRVRFVR
jgi:signal peptidase I